MATYNNLPSRSKSQRLADRAASSNTNSKYEKKHRPQQAVRMINKPTITDLYPGLNEITDAFQAFPFDLIRYFTLLKEIDAKCVNTVPYLKAYIGKFLTMKKTHPKRELLLSKIRDLIKELMPCLEEKMHVATIASDTVNKHLKRINQNYEIIEANEIPESVRIGPLIHPSMKIIEQKSAQSQRSESRREALAARKAHKGKGGEEDDGADDSARSTPVPSVSGIMAPSVQSTSSSNPINLSNSRKKKEKKEKDSNANSEKDSGANSSAGTPYTTTASNTTQAKKRKQTAPTPSQLSNTTTLHDNDDSKQPSVKRPKSIKAKKDRKSREVSPSIAGTPTTSSATNTNAARSGTPQSATQSNSASNKSANKDRSQTNISKTSESSTGSSKHYPTGSITGNALTTQDTSSGTFEGEPVYCYCQQVSYGEMVGCDGHNCEREWFHLPCTDLKELPRGEWFCDDCKAKARRK